jgi:TatD DNase family protein
LKLPVVVHSRDADADMSAMVANAGQAGVRGVLHCFTGPQAVAEAALTTGWYVSFSGIVTFKKWDDLTLLRLVPDDRLLVESDAPYLAPVPFRGKRNEPAFVPRTIERLATVRETTLELLAERTAANASRLFGLAMPESHP